MGAPRHLRCNTNWYANGTVICALKIISKNNFSKFCFFKVATAGVWVNYRRVSRDYCYTFFCAVEFMTRYSLSLANMKD